MSFQEEEINIVWNVARM